MTGMRRGELLALQRGDIDWHGGQIHVRRALYKRRFVTPKSRKGLRAIDMAPTLAHTLQGHLLQVADARDALVFPAKRGKPLDPDNLVKREFQPALVRAGLRQIRFHDLRHTYASLLINNGENIKYIAEQMGHASVQITLDRYGHLFPNVRREAVLRLEKRRTVRPLRLRAAERCGPAPGVRRGVEAHRGVGPGRIGCGAEADCAGGVVGAMDSRGHHGR